MLQLAPPGTRTVLSVTGGKRGRIVRGVSYVRYYREVTKILASHGDLQVELSLAEIAPVHDAKKLWRLLRKRASLKLRNEELLNKKRLFYYALKRKIKELKSARVKFDDLGFSYNALKKDLKRASFFVEWRQLLHGLHTTGHVMTSQPRTAELFIQSDSSTEGRNALLLLIISLNTLLWKRLDGLGEL